MKLNVKVMNCSTYHGLEEYEKSNLAHISLRNEFYISIRDRYGTDISPYDFPYINLEGTPLYYMY